MSPGYARRLINTSIEPTIEEPVMSLPKIVTREEWHAARVDLLADEKALTART